MEDEQPQDLPITVSPGSFFVFEKSGTTIRVGQDGVLDDAGDPAVRNEASDVFASVGHWIGIHIPMAQAGFRLVDIQVLDDMALDLLDDAASEAVEADRCLRRSEGALNPADRLEQQLAAVPHIRKAVILSAASAEAYINEFISRRLPDRAKAIDRLAPPAKWVVAAQLVTGRRLEDETDELIALEELFALRNRVMHFHPKLRSINQNESTVSGRKGVVWQLQKEADPIRFPSLVARCIRALNRLTGSEDVDASDEIIARAIDKRMMGQASDLAAVVGAAWSSLSPEEQAAVEKDFRDEWDEGP